MDKNLMESLSLILKNLTSCGRKQQQEQQVYYNLVRLDLDKDGTSAKSSKSTKLLLLWYVPKF
eukprot:scaffold27186_cov78-Skeletonema_dohrnii-CCMP3373.AAC.1